MLSGKTILVTGGCGGIGLILTKGLLENNAEVILVDKNAQGLEATKEELSSLGSVNAYVADVSSNNQLSSMFSKLNSLDILINCAGIPGPVGPFEENNQEQWLDTIMINFIGTVNCCKAALPLLKKSNHGKIINLGGGGSAYPRLYHTAYGSSKTAVIRFTEVLAQELRGLMDINVIAPGAHNTGMWKEETYDKPPDKWADPKRLVKLIVFLSSDKSNGITGKFIHINDKWGEFDPTISDSELYTLRRVQ